MNDHSNLHEIIKNESTSNELSWLLDSTYDEPPLQEFEGLVDRIEAVPTLSSQWGRKDVNLISNTFSRLERLGEKAQETHDILHAYKYAIFCKEVGVEDRLKEEMYILQDRIRIASNLITNIWSVVQSGEQEGKGLDNAFKERVVAEGELITKRKLTKFNYGTLKQVNWLKDERQNEQINKLILEYQKWHSTLFIKIIVPKLWHILKGKSSEGVINRDKEVVIAKGIPFSLDILTKVDYHSINPNKWVKDIHTAPKVPRIFEEVHDILSSDISRYGMVEYKRLRADIEAVIDNAFESAHGEALDELSTTYSSSVRKMGGLIDEVASIVEGKGFLDTLKTMIGIVEQVEDKIDTDGDSSDILKELMDHESERVVDGKYSSYLKNKLEEFQASFDTLLIRKGELTWGKQ